MDSIEPKKKKISHSNHIAYIHIVGMNKLQNELLLSFLKEKIGCTGICEQKLASKAPNNKDESELSNFLLMDWNNIDSENIWTDISSWKGSSSCQCFFAFCNVDPEMKIEIGPEVELSANDSIFLASDGLFDNFAPDEITELVRKGSMDEISKTLMEIIEKEIYKSDDSKKDDISFILFKN